jgi:hypothetical protein
MSAIKKAQFVTFEVFTAVTMKIPSSGMLRSVVLLRNGVSEELSLPLLVTANVLPSSPILVTLMMEALRSYETSFLTRTTA